MAVNEWLISIVVLLGAIALWRLVRWRYRPDLELGSELRGKEEDFVLTVSNAGAAKARRCRGRLLRVDRQCDGDWRRMDVDQRHFPLVWTDGSGERDLRPSQTADLVVVRPEGLTPGRYRLELAVIDGEERRVSVEFRWPMGKEEGVDR
jgi:hypothetical protein